MGVATLLLQNLKASSYLSEDPEAAKVFKFILQKSAAPGWMIVKELGQDADSTEIYLKRLRDLGLLEGDRDGLDGFYHSTSLGYSVREALSLY